MSEQVFVCFAVCKTGVYKIDHACASLAEAEHVACNIRRYVPDCMRDDVICGQVRVMEV